MYVVDMNHDAGISVVKKRVVEQVQLCTFFKSTTCAQRAISVHRPEIVGQECSRNTQLSCVFEKNRM
jgi:hypothetical protein